VQVETFLPGREFTVGLIGTGSEAVVLGTIEVHFLAAAEPEVYSYQNKENCERLVKYRLVNAVKDAFVRDAEDIALKAWRVLGCRDAGRIDIRCDDEGNPHFMEVNPLAGIHPEHSDLPIICNQLGMPYRELIKKIMSSAEKRIRVSQTPGTRLAATGPSASTAYSVKPVSVFSTDLAPNRG
jgi:D-alanine-D-alanine ligase